MTDDDYILLLILFPVEVIELALVLAGGAIAIALCVAAAIVSLPFYLIYKIWKCCNGCLEAKIEQEVKNRIEAANPGNTVIVVNGERTQELSLFRR